MSSRDVRQALADFVAGTGAAQAELGKVVAVDTQAQTCDVQVDEGYILYDVRLTPVADSPTVLVPAVGSWVVAATIEGSASLRYVAMTSQIDTLALRGEQFGGIVKIDELYDALTSLKSYCESLASAVSAGLTAVGAGTAANGETGAVEFSRNMAGKTIDVAEKSAMQNENIKHG